MRSKMFGFGPLSMLWPFSQMFSLLLGMSFVGDDDGGSGDGSGDGEGEGTGGEGEGDSHGQGEGTGDDDGNGEGDDGDLTDEEADRIIQERGKNIIMENKRKGKENSTLKQEVADLKAKIEAGLKAAPDKGGSNDPDIVKRFKEKWADKSDPEFLKDITDLMTKVSRGVARSETSDVREVAAIRRVEKEINNMAKDNKKYKFIVSTHGVDGIIDTLKEMKFDPKYWSEKRVLRMAFGDIIALADDGDGSDDDKGKNKLNRGFSENKGAGDSKGGAGIPEDKLREYAAENNLNYDLGPEVRKKIRESYKKYSDAKKREDYR